MKTKKIIGIILFVLGIVGLIIGLMGIFGSQISNLSPWPFAILGVIFFTSSMGMLKSMNE